MTRNNDHSDDSIPRDFVPIDLEKDIRDQERLMEGVAPLTTDLPQYAKKPIEQILEESKTIDVQKAADEILKWTIDNVENFIDNHRKIYKLDLVLDASESMAESKRLQDLYRAIPSDDDVIDPQIIQKAIDDESFSLGKDDDARLAVLQACREKLDELTQSVYECMRKQTDVLRSLFERLIYYYELKGFKSGDLLIEELEGNVDVIKFEYEAFPVAVKVKAPKVAIRDENGEISEIAEATTKEYIIPEGFTLWIELAFRPKMKMTSLF